MHMRSGAACTETPFSRTYAYARQPRGGLAILVDVPPFKEPRLASVKGDPELLTSPLRLTGSWDYGGNYHSLRRAEDQTQGPVLVGQTLYLSSIGGHLRAANIWRDTERSHFISLTSWIRRTVVLPLTGWFCIESCPGTHLGPLCAPQVPQCHLPSGNSVLIHQ
jgi:hypothetical protein